MTIIIEDANMFWIMLILGTWLFTILANLILEGISRWLSYKIAKKK